MKRKTTLLLMVTVLIVMTCAACKNDAVVCSNCAVEVDASSLYCSSCGAQLSEGTEATTDTTEITTDPTDGTQGTTEVTTGEETDSIEATIPPTTEPPATTPPTTAPPVTVVHTHSYSPTTKAATCTEQGYTTYTCSCGHSYTADEVAAKGHAYSQAVTAPTCTEQGYTTYTCSCGHSYVGDYINPSHTYSNYVCGKCGSIDKSHAYEYLVSYINQNGTANGTQMIIKDYSQATTFELLYDEQAGYASILQYFYSGDQFFFSSVDLDANYYYTSFNNCKVTGFLNAETFTANSAISYTDYQGQISSKQDMINLARIACCDMVGWLSWYLSENNVGITIADLGFSSY